jgi:hypothetical protein
MMKLQVDPNQTFQLDAVGAGFGLVGGQPRGALEYALISLGARGDLFAGQERTKLGGDKLLANTHAIQTRNDIEVADQSAPLAAFHKNLIGPEAEQKSNVIYNERKKLSGCQPIKFVEIARPIVITDEPLGDHRCT